MSSALAREEAVRTDLDLDQGIARRTTAKAGPALPRSRNIWPSRVRVEY
jgi:hypothetical protein